MTVNEVFYVKKTTKRWLISAGIFFALFLALIILLLTVDIGYAVLHAPVGLSTINGFVFKAIGVNGEWEAVSGILLLAAIGVVVIFAVLWGIERISGRPIYKMSKEKKFHDFHCIAAALLLLFLCFVFFEIFIVNYRPIVEHGGETEPSFPSTHTLISVVVFGTAMVWLAYRLKKMGWKVLLIGLLGSMMIFAVLARLMMGVHWITDILGGVLLGGAITSLCGAGFCYLRECE